MPMKSFLTRISPSFGVGMGRSVLYWRTSVPPVFSISMPFMVFGNWVEDAIVLRFLGGKWEWRRERRVVDLINSVNWIGNVEKILRVDRGMQICCVGEE